MEEEEAVVVVVLVDKGKKPGGCGWSGERGDDVRRGLGRGRFVERGAAGGPHGMAVRSL